MHATTFRLLCLATALGIGPWASAQPASPPRPQSVRPIPPPGVDVPDDVRVKLDTGLADLKGRIDRLAEAEDAEVRSLLPDVQIFHKAVQDALTHGEFFKENEFGKAERLLKAGLERADQLARGEPAWTRQSGLVVRGYVSKIDGSVQPYGLVIPATYQADFGRRHRLDLWFHGRGETLSEVNFLDERMTRPGQFTPIDTIVLHPYGRYCNANKFAGEVDTLEALASVQARYPIDPDRISVRGFSMGGAAAWHLAVHHAERWFAANPGAGFSETPRFIRLSEDQIRATPWYEKQLWNWYDAPGYAPNLLGLPTVAYSGEIDRQKQAADVMAEALRDWKVELTHVIGPQTEHKYHPESAAEVDRRLDTLAVAGRNRHPARLQFATYTLRYNRMHWLTVDGMGRHWERALVSAGVDGEEVQVQAENVTAITLDFPPGSPLTPQSGSMLVRVDGQSLEGPLVNSDRSWRFSMHRDGQQWVAGPLPSDGLHKRHGLQGPVDDAFLDSFLFVLPGGQCRSEQVDAWVNAESRRALDQWRRQFRGEPRVKTDHELTEDDVANHNLVLWGDPQANAVLRTIVDRLPIQWGPDAIQVGDQTFPADSHAAILIYPNPLNPDRYVVINSGFTFREADLLSNARQNPKLPDWTIVGLDTPADAYQPGRIAAADFFDEQWRLRPARPPDAP